ncbi:MAG: hypothetical protein ACFCUU_06405 [Cyclobacteriaceae bacterium]
MQKAILIIASCFLTLRTFAQDKIITLRVVDNLTKQPLENVAICHSDTVLQKTNDAGYAQFEASVGDTLFLSCNYFKEKYIIIIPNQPRIQVTLDKAEEKFEYEGGLSLFYEYWTGNLRYPSKARSKLIQAYVYLEFTIDSLGYTKYVQIHNDHKNLFEKEIRLTFESIPGKWNVDYLDKTILFPIRFQLAGFTPPEKKGLAGIKPNILLEELVIMAY